MLNGFLHGIVQWLDSEMDQFLSIYLTYDLGAGKIS